MSQQGEAVCKGQWQKDLYSNDTLLVMASSPEVATERLGK
jgi:hypothetical protein